MKDCDLFPPQNTTPICLDSSGAKAIAQGGGEFRSRKHIDVRHHFVLRHAMLSDIVLQKVPSEDNVADINTKALGRNLFNKHFSSIMGGINH